MVILKLSTFLVKILLFIDVDLCQQLLDSLQRGRQEYGQRLFGSYLAIRFSRLVIVNFIIRPYNNEDILIFLP